MKTTRSFLYIALVALVILAVLGGAGYGIYTFINRTITAPAPTPTPVPITPVPVPITPTPVKVCPNNCTGNGTCDSTSGLCKCDTNYSGADCSTFTPPQKTCPPCLNSGTCNPNTGECICTDFFSGSNCSCPKCFNGGTCNENTGKCICINGYTGDTCSNAPCPGNCSGHGSCLNGTCTCNIGYGGLDCATICPAGFSGVDCNEPSKCLKGGDIVFEDDGTGPTFRGTCCNTKDKVTSVSEGRITTSYCPEMKLCPKGCNGNGTCDYSSGVCTCNAGYTGVDCSGECNSYGVEIGRISTDGTYSIINRNPCCSGKTDILPLEQGGYSVKCVV